MLWFLSIASKRGLVVESYCDEAVGVMARNAEGRLSMTRVTLRPNIQFTADRQPRHDEVEAMHHEAHEQCFIANSVKTEVCCEGVFR